MRCNVCGRQSQNEEANFCEYCGSSFREHMQAPFPMPSREQGNPYGNGPTPMMHGNNMAQGNRNTEGKESISFLNWLGTYGLLFIPIVGWLVFIIMLFIWSFSNNTPTSKKNWARATLIYAGVMIIIAIALFVMFYLPLYQQIYQQMMNGTFDYNSYNEILQQYY